MSMEYKRGINGFDRHLERLRNLQLTDFANDIIDTNNASLAAKFLLFNSERLSNTQVQAITETILSGEGNESGLASLETLKSDLQLRCLNRDQRVDLARDVIERSDYTVIRELVDILHLLGLDTYLPQVRAKLQEIDGASGV